MNSNKITLPREYLSWSQMSLWKYSKEQYKKIYILGEEQYINPAMIYGQKVAKAMETGKTEDEVIAGLYALLPKYKTPEKKLEAKIEGIPVLGKLDSYNPKTHDFYEYKTGKVPWTTQRADKHGQLTFYAMLVYLNYKVLPKVKLIWAETELENGEITATGRIKEFPTKRTLADILRFMAEIKKTAKQISKAYLEELNKTLK